MTNQKVLFTPVDADAEAQILAALLTSPATFSDVADLLTPDDFGVPANAMVYEAIITVDAAAKPVDVITVADELRRRKLLTKVGGTGYLHELVERMDVSANAGAHADIIKSKSLLRRLVDTGREIAATALAPEADAADSLELAETKVFELGEARTRSTFVAMPEAVNATLGELAKVRSKLLLGHPTGFAELDALTGGFQGGQLITLAARPGMGKSALGLQFATHIAATTGLMVPFISYEMSMPELTMRMFAAQLGYDLHKLRQGDIPPGLEHDLALAAQALAELPVVIDDNPPPTISGVRSAMRRLARRGQLGAIVIDYLQLMEGDRRFKDLNRTQEVSDISRGLKRLASELNVPVIALSQLNRQLESRPNKRPMLSDLRESGSIEQDSSLVLFLYRDYVYNTLADPKAAEILIAKQRNGPSMVSVFAKWDGASARYLPAPPGYSPSAAPSTQAVASTNGF